MELDPIQQQAIDRAMTVVRSGGAFKLMGKAGTGKTTTGLAIVKAIMDAGYKVICCAYTNKAVNRMREVGYPAQFCRTVHRLLYSTGIHIEVGEYSFTESQADKILHMRDVGEAYNIFTDIGLTGEGHENPAQHKQNIFNMVKAGRGSRVSGTVPKTPEQLEKEGITRDTVIILDELSMCPLDSADELHGMFRSVVYIGDPGQLPPVNSVDTCKYLSADDTVELETIHRVSGNTRLLDMIYDLDAGKMPADVGPIQIEKVHHMVREGYKLICYTNDGVAWLNNEARIALELSGKTPCPQEPLITTGRTRAERIVQITDENRSWFLGNEKRLREAYTGSRGSTGASSYNRDDRGRVVSVSMVRTISKNMILECAGPPEPIGNFFIMPVIIEGDPERRVWTVKTAPFWSMDVKRKKAFRKVGHSMALDFAYAITAHKAQGSEWKLVAVMVRQAYPRDRGNPEALDEINRWNYTAATRGRDNIQLFSSIFGCPHG